MAVRSPGWRKACCLLLILAMVLVPLTYGSQPAHALTENLQFSISHGDESLYAQDENYKARSSVAGVGTVMEFKFALGRELGAGDTVRIGFPAGFSLDEGLNRDDVRLSYSGRTTVPAEVSLTGDKATGYELTVDLPEGEVISSGEEITLLLEPYGEQGVYPVTNPSEAGVYTLTLTVDTSAGPVTTYADYQVIAMGLTASEVDLTTGITPQDMEPEPQSEPEYPPSVTALYFYNYNYTELNKYAGNDNNVVMEFQSNASLGGKDTIELRFPAEYGGMRAEASYSISVNGGEMAELGALPLEGEGTAGLMLQMPAGISVLAGDKVQVFLGLVKNPAFGGSYLFSVRTSAQTEWADYWTSVYDKSVSELQITAGEYTAGARQVPYDFRFTYRPVPVLYALTAMTEETTDGYGDAVIQLQFPPGYELNRELSALDVSVHAYGPDGEYGMARSEQMEPKEITVTEGEGGERNVELRVPASLLPPYSVVDICFAASAGIVHPGEAGAYVLQARLAGEEEWAAYTIDLREAEPPADTAIRSVQAEGSSQEMVTENSEYTLQVPSTVSGPVKLLVELNDERAELRAEAAETTVAGVTYGREEERARYYVLFDGLAEGRNAARVVVTAPGAETRGYTLVVERMSPVAPPPVPLDGTPYPLSAAFPAGLFGNGDMKLDFSGSLFAAGAFVSAEEVLSPEDGAGMTALGKIVKVTVSGVTLAPGQSAKLTLSKTSGADQGGKPAGYFVRDENGQGWKYDPSVPVRDTETEVTALLPSVSPSLTLGIFAADTAAAAKIKLGKPAGGMRELNLSAPGAAALYYSIDGQPYRKYTPNHKPSVKAGAKIQVYAAEYNRIDRAPMEWTAPLIPPVASAQDVLVQLDGRQDFNGDGVFDREDVTDYLGLIEPQRAIPQEASSS
ncbi:MULTISPECIES: hypothetical protein [Paenibacillus]|uniref:hypothetical protein n=1 Tax=Paenibacillus TaxID=44249 RepID=UPI00387360FF